MAAAKVLQLRLFKTRFLQCVTHDVNFNRFFERNFDNRTTGKIQPPVKTAYAHDDYGRHQQKAGDAESPVIPAHKVIDFTAMI